MSRVRAQSASGSRHLHVAGPPKTLSEKSYTKAPWPKLARVLAGQAPPAKKPRFFARAAQAAGPPHEEARSPQAPQAPFGP